METRCSPGVEYHATQLSMSTQAGNMRYHHLDTMFDQYLYVYAQSALALRLRPVPEPLERLEFSQCGRAICPQVSAICALGH